MVLGEGAQARARYLFSLPQGTPGVVGAHGPELYPCPHSASRALSPLPCARETQPDCFKVEMSALCTLPLPNLPREMSRFIPVPHWGHAALQCPMLLSKYHVEGRRQPAHQTGIFIKDIPYSLHSIQPVWGYPASVLQEGGLHSNNITAFLAFKAINLQRKVPLLK